eukprot:scaffold125_cov240-Pinguiococcus_pyrenoidosus.AAC.3
MARKSLCPPCGTFGCSLGGESEKHFDLPVDWPKLTEKAPLLRIFRANFIASLHFFPYLPEVSFRHKNLRSMEAMSSPKKLKSQHEYVSKLYRVPGEAFKPKMEGVQRVSSAPSHPFLPVGDAGHICTSVVS